MSQNDDKLDQLHSMGSNYEAHLGIAGRTARFFIQSPLSPLFFLAMMLMGLLGLIITPRQEDPQISVPMVDIFVQYPGAAADQVAALAIEPLERIMSEIPDVKHVYSASQRGGGVVTIEFEVGEEMGPSTVKVNDKIDSNMDLIPPGVMPPLVKSKGIDDVPVVTLTLWSKDVDRDGVPDVDDGQLRMLAHDVLQSLKELPDTGNGFVVGGRREQVTIEVFPERLAGFGISLDQVASRIKESNSEQWAGSVEAGSTYKRLVSGAFLTSVEDINRLVVGTHNEVNVYMHDIARVKQGPEDAKQLVGYYTGAANDLVIKADGVPAVTLAIAKKEGSNGVSVADSIKERIEHIKGSLIPGNVEVSVTRNYGKTANDKVSELIFKLFMATGFVFLLVLAAFRAFRPAIVVVLVIPVVLLMTIFSAWVMGYTIDRVSLFALIFSIGILVDDAIVVVENIYRRWLEEKSTDVVIAVDAVREVGNPTILATFTVIAALLPMGFVTGMMGPYMEPIPALGSVAMLISLFAAFVFTPYLTVSHWLRPSMHYLEVAGEREHKEAKWLEGLFKRILMPMIESPRKARLFKLIMWGTFFVTCSFFYFKWVAVKMLPLDNKPEFAVVLDMPEGTALPVTANLAHRMAEKIRVMPEVTAVQVYAGTARPFDFNGMVRHYYLRSDPWHAEVQVQLLDKTERSRTSHEIAVETRAVLGKITEGTGAKLAVVEMPPGPPVLQSVVAEVHGPSSEVRRQLAEDLTTIFKQTESLRDVDNYMRDPYQYWRFTVDTEKSVRRGISVDTINRNLGMALGGSPLGDVKQRAGHESINIMMQVPLAERSEVTRLGDLPIHSSSGVTIPLRELGRFEQVLEDPIIYHKDLRDVEYVVAEVGGKLAAPVYGMMQVQDLLAESGYKAPDDVAIETEWLGPPKNDSRSAIEWAGEWTVTYETFRDMGAAFAVALVLIYILVVWEFGNFRIPALIMAPIPLTLLGIIPAHFIFFQAGWGGEFTATSMIGWIALAGIIVRNSILLVDFSIHQVQQGTSVVDAVIMACTTRTRPIMITAFALVCGSSVIFFDPIFQGMAISLASGVLVSTILTLIVIPLGCIAASKDIIEVATATAPEGSSVAQGVEIHMAPLLAAETHTAVETKHEEKDTLPIVIWAKFIAVVSILFYLIRGILLLIGQLVKGLFRRGKSQQEIDAKGKGAATGEGDSSNGSNSGGVAPDGNASVDEDNESITAAPVRRRATASSVIKREVKTDAELEQKTVLTPPAAKTVARKAQSSLTTPTKQSKTQLTETSEVVETRAAKPTKEVKKQALSTEKSSPGSAPKQRKRPSTLKKQVVKKKTAADKSKGNGTPEKASSTKPTTKRVSNVTNFSIRKKAVRRGIRLK
ncbi:MAG: efflux RND transporter permease subunit [Candidatus Thiodiazotropha sp. (ex Lucinoma aequizonata)]|nr:efflux RND transporter permease subunit [Candidatus Thiodiazotropha sp. (ex Lucinoma aequizonata)]MCU7888605.1 efflux RND transporter permease subunit [Candidatus Thiodiazotropha sp. (ex Lucinoma aequizonata)]MCU7893972.1 efflux RND transporter permease subunit [Candidatus Thiodiazotropha sp. (ex Lucinoma aequizonata)]MCU7898849.1 efflux RND transporter permease subunit [Candidatus Thiodiazotropha sp. (ex Lucinoma aequizonata)]MCU7902031.1 efflux RND transporter permease subunit [Candidatus 